MNRVLDIDLDFFVRPPAHWRADDGARLPEDEYETWSAEDALSFLRGPVGLASKVRGWVIEHHDEAFAKWRDAIANNQLQAPFHVTHLDAHADLGYPNSGLRYLLTEVMHRPAAERYEDAVIKHCINFGNWLAFAVACQWVHDLDYVFGVGGGSDIPGPYLNEDFTGLQFRAATVAELDRQIRSIGVERLTGPPDPVVPLRQVRAEEFAANGPYDTIVLCRSPGYTPSSADSLFDLIRAEFIDESW